MLRELNSLFQAFDICPVGNLRKRTIDPMGLRVALAKLDAKRFAAGAPSLSSRQRSRCMPCASVRPDGPASKDQQATVWLSCHARALPACSRGSGMQGR